MHLGKWHIGVRLDWLTPNNYSGGKFPTGWKRWMRSKRWTNRKREGRVERQRRDYEVVTSTSAGEPCIRAENPRLIYHEGPGLGSYPCCPQQLKVVCLQMDQTILTEVGSMCWKFRLPSLRASTLDEAYHILERTLHPSHGNVELI